MGGSLICEDAVACDCDEAQLNGSCPHSVAHHRSDECETHPCHGKVVWCVPLEIPDSMSSRRPREIVDVERTGILQA